MNKKYLHIFIFIAALGACTACSSSWEDQFDDTPFEATVDASLTVGTEKLEFTDEASTQNIDIAAKGYWTATTSANWLKLGMTHGKGNASLGVSVDANMSTTQSRTATISVSNGLVTHSVSVTQEHMTELLQTARNELSYGFQGGTDNVGVESNVAWTVSSSASWVTVNRNQEGTGFSVTAQQNISTNARQATITVKGVTLNRTITVSQGAVRVPNVAELVVNGVTKHTANCKMEASSSDLEIIEYGICYSNVASTPTVDNAVVLKQDGGGRNVLHVFNLTDLTSKTTYYVRPYVVTSLGRQYGEIVRFTTPVSAPNEGDNGTPQD